MLESIPGVGPFVTGAIVGLGQGLGHKVMAMVLKYLGRAGKASETCAISADCRVSSHAERAESQGRCASSDDEDLAQVVSSLKNEAEWKNLESALNQSGLPLDSSAAKALATLGDEVLKKEIGTANAVGRLAKLTAEAFERAGIELPDLARWDSLSARLADDDSLTPVEEEVGPASIPVAVANVKRPATWWIWSREDVDGRLLRFVARGVEHCWTGCNQALTAIHDLSALRQLRELREQLVLIRELLQTMTPLVPDKRALRVEGWRVKQLLSGVEQAVQAAETLSNEMRIMLASQPGNKEWQTAFTKCGQSAAVLVQTLRDRRAVR